jgi:flagellar basal body P-ring formation protein FlgA
MIGRALLIAGVGLTAFAGECTPVSGDRIFGRDLKSAGLAGGILADDAPVALAPLPGLRRTVTRRELAKLGIEAGDVCFERAVRALDPANIEAAMRSALNRPGVSIEITDYSRTAVPGGTIEFPLSGLSRPPESQPQAAVIWRGRIRYDGGRSAAVWASVHVSEMRTWLESRGPLTTAEIIREEQVQVRKGAQFPLTATGLADAAQVVGRKARRAIAPGQPLFANMFEEPPLVVRGDTIRASVASGAVVLAFDARAETSGRAGQHIVVIDPAKGQRFQAKVVEKGKVTVDIQTTGRRGPVRGDVVDGGAGSTR